MPVCASCSLKATCRNDPRCVCLRWWKCLPKGWSRWPWSWGGNPPSSSLKTASCKMQWRARSWPTSWPRDRWGLTCCCCSVPTRIVTRVPLQPLRRSGLLQRDQSVRPKRDPAPVPGRSGEEDQGHPSGGSFAGRHTHGGADQQTAPGQSVGLRQSGQETGRVYRKNIQDYGNGQ